MKKSKIYFLYFFIFYFLNINTTENKKILIFGGQTGWVGQKIVKIIKELGYNAICATSRLENRNDLIKEINEIKPNYIINAAGLTGRPNIDWCEDNKQETIRVNIIGTLNLADIAFLNGIHLTNFGTGCIYQYDEKHPLNSTIGFKEEDEPNFFGSFYSKTKGYLEKLLLQYPNVLNLRVRMPISSDFHPRNFINKITTYKKVVNVPNSLSVLDDLLPVAVQMTIKCFHGNFNLVNPGVMSHNEILELYKKYVDPNFKYENFTLEDQAKVLKAQRSNCYLDTTKLLKYFPEIPNIKISLEKILKDNFKNFKS